MDRLQNLVLEQHLIGKNNTLLARLKFSVSHPSEKKTNGKIVISWNSQTQFEQNPIGTLTKFEKWLPRLLGLASAMASRTPALGNETKKMVLAKAWGSMPWSQVKTKVWMFCKQHPWSIIDLWHVSCWLEIFLETVMWNLQLRFSLFELTRLSGWNPWIIGPKMRMSYCCDCPQLTNKCVLTANNDQCQQ